MLTYGVNIYETFYLYQVCLPIEVLTYLGAYLSGCLPIGVLTYLGAYLSGCLSIGNESMVSSKLRDPITLADAL